MNNKGSDIFTIFLNYLKHKLSARHRQAYGIHSPYVYDLVRNAVFNNSDINVPEDIISYHRKLRRNMNRLEFDQKGAGSRVSISSSRKIASLAKRSSVSYKQGAFLYRLASWYKPKSILEFGTGLGISTSYLASASPGIDFSSVEGSIEKCNFIKSNISQSGLADVELICSDFDGILPELFDKLENRSIVFIDGDHRYSPTIEKVTKIVNNRNLKDVLIVLDDIYWSNSMQKAFKECIELENVSISLDLFFFGILIKRPGIAKQHFKVNF